MNKQELLAKLVTLGIPSPLVKAISLVDRELFVPQTVRFYVYEDTALPIEHGLTLPPVSIVAQMLTLLEVKEHQKIVEIGAGSGYVLALLATAYPSTLLFGLEINPRVAFSTVKRLEMYKNIHLFAKSGEKGFPEQAPFDRILLSAVAENVETLLRFLPQLTEGGIILGPVGDKLVQINRTEHSYRITEHQGTQFVPLVKEKIP